jgi:ribose-phosphate pyrophosphokinase
MKLPWNKDNSVKSVNIPEGDKSFGDLIMDNSIEIRIINEFYYKVLSYPDGSKYVKVYNIYNDLTFKINSYEDLWILNQIHDVVKSKGRYVTVTIPNLIDAQADRRFNSDESSGLKLVCNFLNGLSNFNYKIFHPHNQEVVEALLDRVEIIDNSEFINQVISIKLNARIDNSVKDNLILMSSDAGGFKPLMKLADKLAWRGETFSASKSRKYEEGKSKLLQQIDRQDFNGKDILIIDDICVYGGTFKGLAKMLRERNCGKLYLAVSHMTVENLGEDPVTDYFDMVYTTNSKFEFYDKPEKYHGDRLDNLEIIKLF